MLLASRLVVDPSAHLFLKIVHIAFVARHICYSSCFENSDRLKEAIPCDDAVGLSIKGSRLQHHDGLTHAKTDITDI